jgi:hypothetical protein
MTYYSNRSRYNPRALLANATNCVFDAISASLRELAPLTSGADVRRRALLANATNIAGRFAKRHTDWQGAVSAFAKEYSFLFAN